MEDGTFSVCTYLNFDAGGKGVLCWRVTPPTRMEGCLCLVGLSVTGFEAMCYKHVVALQILVDKSGLAVSTLNDGEVSTVRLSCKGGGRPRSSVPRGRVFIR